MMSSRISSPLSEKEVPFISPHVVASGASPTGYFISSSLWNAMSKKSFEDTKNSPATIQYFPSTSYNNFHLSAFLEKDQMKMIADLVENSTSTQLNKEDHNGNTPLMWAVVQGREDLVQLFVEQSSNVRVNAQNHNGETALYIAASSGFSSICSFLMQNGANSRISTVEGASPVHIAAANGHLAALEVLSKYGASFNDQDEEGDTPLHYAVRSGQEKVVEYLVQECKVFVDQMNEDEESALDLASCLGEHQMVQLLSKHSKHSN